MSKPDPDEWEVISAYPLERAIADGLLVPVFAEIAGDKPIVATSHLCHELTYNTLWQIWTQFSE
jgi:hypothetical protein